MITRQSLLQRREEVLRIARHHGASNVRVFGSVARGDVGDGSDVDLIVRFEPERSLLDHAALISDLEEFLGVKVDVVDEEAMRPRFRAVVEREARAL